MLLLRVLSLPSGEERCCCRGVHPPGIGAGIERCEKLTMLLGCYPPVVLLLGIAVARGLGLPPAVELLLLSGVKVPKAPKKCGCYFGRGISY